MALDRASAGTPGLRCHVCVQSLTRVGLHPSGEEGPASLGPALAAVKGHVFPFLPSGSPFSRQSLLFQGRKGRESLLLDDFGGSRPFLPSLAIIITGSTRVANTGDRGVMVPYTQPHRCNQGSFCAECPLKEPAFSDPGDEWAAHPAGACGVSMLAEGRGGPSQQVSMSPSAGAELTAVTCSVRAWPSLAHVGRRPCLVTTHAQEALPRLTAGPMETSCFS